MSEGGWHRSAAHNSPEIAAVAEGRMPCEVVAGTIATFVAATGAINRATPQRHQVSAVRGLLLLAFDRLFGANDKTGPSFGRFVGRRQPQRTSVHNDSRLLPVFLVPSPRDL